MAHFKKYAVAASAILLTVFVVYFYVWDYVSLKNKGAYTFLIESDKDNAYERLLYIKSVNGDKKFELFLTELLSATNTDMLTQLMALRYIRENERKEYLPNLIELNNRLNKINPDSTWETKVSARYSRTNKTQNSALLYDLQRTIKEFEED